MTPPAALDEWLRPTVAADRYGVHPDTLKAWANSGRIRVHRTLGGHRRYCAADLTAVFGGNRP